jgi:hypothetical protein
MEGVHVSFLQATVKTILFLILEIWFVNYTCIRRFVASNNQQLSNIRVFNKKT